MKAKTKIAVFASGNGSNFSVLAEACQTGELHAEIAIVITDRPTAYVLERAKRAHIRAVAFQPQAYPTKEAYEKAILETLQQTEVEWIILAGYMRLIGETLLTAYPNRIVNIHPSLLPAFPGKAAIEQAIAHGVKVTGVTVHLVDEGMDTGPILAQQAVKVVSGDIEQTAKAIHAVEHTLYKETLKQLLNDQD